MSRSTAGTPKRISRMRKRCSIATTPRLIAAAKPTHPKKPGSASMQSSTETAMTAVRILAACLALALAGCVETRFESPIGDNIETCDAGWKGLWIDADAPNRDPPEKADAAFYVNDACEFIVLDQPEPKGPLKQIHVPINYVHADGKDYVVVVDSAIKGLADIKAPYGVTPVPEKSFYFARYKLRGDRLDVYQV